MSRSNVAATQQQLGSKILLEVGTNELEVLVFHLENYRYGINGAKVREVVHPPPIRPVPNAHPSLDGMCKLRDEVIPMVSLRKYFGFPALPASATGGDDSQVIVTVFNNQSIAFRVDRVDRIFRVSWKNMRPMPELFESDRNHFTGLTIIEEHIVLMCDLEKIAEEINGQRLRAIHARQEAEPPGRPKPLAGISVLYAEDSQMIQMMTCDLLRGAGVEQLHVFNNGQDAWEWLEKNQAESPVDIVVSDIEMPLMDGLHLSSRIRAYRETKDLPIVLLSSLINPDNERKGRAVGVNAQLVKSKIQMLPELIRPLLN